MIEEKPSTACLLRLARATLAAAPGRRSLEERQEDIALIERIIAIAQRELSAGGGASEARRRISAFYDGEPPETAWRRLAGDIRAGLFDAPGARREAVRRLLWAVTEEKLRISNPDFLAAADPPQLA